MCNSGIYIILNRVKGKGYIGSSVNIPRRWSYHRYQLKKGTHTNKVLQNAWNKYGPDAFEFHVIEEVSDTEKLAKREQVWLDVCLKLMPFYNIKDKAYYSAKLTERDVFEIRELHKAGIMPDELVEKYPNVTKSTIKQIIYNRTWKHLLNKNNSK